jgi:hypothetical protein
MPMIICGKNAITRAAATAAATIILTGISKTTVLIPIPQQALTAAIVIMLKENIILLTVAPAAAAIPPLFGEQNWFAPTAAPIMPALSARQTAAALLLPTKAAPAVMVAAESVRVLPAGRTELPAALTLQTVAPVSVMQVMFVLPSARQTPPAVTEPVS